MTSCLPPILTMSSRNLSWSLPCFIFCFPVLISIALNTATTCPTISGVTVTDSQPIRSGIPSGRPWKGLPFFRYIFIPPVLFLMIAVFFFSAIHPIPQFARNNRWLGFKFFNRPFMISRSFCPMRIMSHIRGSISSIFYGGMLWKYCMF